MSRPLVYALLRLAVLMLTLSGCAHLPRTAMAPKDADCRHVISPDGEPLRFCETGKRVTVERTTAPVATKRMIDDPQFLATMIDQLPRLDKSEAAGLKDQARICAAATPGYITIRASDFAKMGGAPSPAAPVAEKVSALNAGARAESAD